MHEIEDTIVAIATPLGEGGLGVVRLSGPKAIQIVSKFLKASNFNLQKSKTHTLHHAWVVDENNPIDEVVVSLFHQPKSYTGEDVVEISCHGSPVVLKEVVRLCQKKGARLARPGEFTERAYLNGKMDLSQAEAVADLISSKSTKARAMATDQLEGALSKRIKEIQTPLISLLAKIEANLDFVEEDIPGLPKKEMKQKLEQAQKSIASLLSTTLKARYLKEGIRVVLLGKPNVGKSSLFNALLSQERSIVTDVPGTTRDIIEEQLQWNGFPVILTDTAGLRSTQDVVEKIGTQRAYKAKEKADVNILVLDASSKPTEEDQKIFGQIKNEKFICALNKQDKLKNFSRTLFEQQFPSPAFVETSAKTGRGLEALRDQVLSILAPEGSDSSESSALTNERHIRLLEQANQSLKKACLAAESKNSEEAISMDVKDGVKNLAALTGEDVSEEVLSSIFTQFCIGK